MHPHNHKLCVYGEQRIPGMAYAPDRFDADKISSKSECCCPECRFQALFISDATKPSRHAVLAANKDYIVAALQHNEQAMIDAWVRVERAVDAFSMEKYNATMEYKALPLVVEAG